MFVTERFEIDASFKRNLKRRKENFGYGSLGLATYYRTYSRTKPDGTQERWADTVLRTVEGALSIRKDHYVKNGIDWDESRWQAVGQEMANYVFDIKVLPPGRGLWAGGTDMVYEKGSYALNNCAFRSVTKISHDAAWIMNVLMFGVGAGFDTFRGTIDLQQPQGDAITWQITDDREGWVHSVRLLLEAYENGTAPVEFDYSVIRPEGSPIKGFGGIASGAGPLKTLHADLRTFSDRRARGEISSVRYITDVINRIAMCVVAGNVRRSALIALGRPDDVEFLNLKDWRLPENRERMDWQTGWGHTSNNTVVFETAEDFDFIPEIAKRIAFNGEPGILNLMNVQKYARNGEKSDDRAIGTNPCGEICLESSELCNLAEVFPTRCKNEEEIYRAMELATIYASSISLLPTGDPETDAVLSRNRRIGVSISGFADWVARTPRKSDIVRIQNDGYDLVRKTNNDLAEEAQVPASIRVTTVKPSGTISLLAGVSAGMHHPIFETYIRRVKIGTTAPIAALLDAAGVPSEPDDKDPKGTRVYEFPINQKGVRAQDAVSVSEHGLRLIMLSRFWADNAVSNTSTFRATKYTDIEGDEHMYSDEMFVAKGKNIYVKKWNAEGSEYLCEIEDIIQGEEDEVAYWLTYVVPHVKSISMLSYMNGKTVYRQAPYEGITVQEFKERSDAIEETSIDWNNFGGSDGEDSRYCEGDYCVV